MSENITLKDLHGLFAEVAEAQKKTEAEQQKTEEELRAQGERMDQGAKSLRREI